MSVFVRKQFGYCSRSSFQVQSNRHSEKDGKFTNLAKCSLQVSCELRGKFVECDFGPFLFACKKSLVLENAGSEQSSRTISAL